MKRQSRLERIREALPDGCSTYDQDEADIAWLLARVDELVPLVQTLRKDGCNCNKCTSVRDALTHVKEMDP